MQLPWRVVLTEDSEGELLDLLEKSENTADALVRRRGFIQLIDSNPADIVLPPRCLPIYLLNGRNPKEPEGRLAALTRRLTMLDALKRLTVKELVVLGGSEEVLPTELTDLWQEGLRTVVTVVSNAPSAADDIQNWRSKQALGTVAAYLPLPAADFCEQLLSEYARGEPDERVTVRMRNFRGDTQAVDLTAVDDPEHPLLANYEMLQDAQLRPLRPDDLKVADVEGFFTDPSISWRPYAAGMPWMRDDQVWQRLRGILRKLDKDGADANRVAYVSAESGSGGTTLLRMLAWFAAQEGYPTLVARGAPFTPKALEAATFMTRVVEAQRDQRPSANEDPLYEPPWLFAFDRMHWEGRVDELVHFLRELERSGRPACILIVAGPYIGTDFYNSQFVRLSTLSHEVPLPAAISLGEHLNTYLAPHGPTRTEADWRAFYEETAVQAQRGIAAFWIALSFWLQRQFDIRETVQAWIFRQFTDRVHDPQVRAALLDIAALSTERFPLPDTMLPATVDWPVTQKIEDLRREVPALGLAHIARDGDRYWALAHDLIGRYLLTALFYDAPARDAAGFADALNPEHLRFLVLRRLSRMSALGQTQNRAIAEEFASSIFKIDPDHGHANFVPFWRDALQALDEMPKALRMTSRSFRHHSAVSRRRICKHRELFPMEPDERVGLLQRAVEDIRYALDFIPASADEETDLNLYNSLAHAYQDWADEEETRGSARERIEELRTRAHEATLQAYRANPDNSFVVETFARSLLSEAKANPDKAAENAVEVLNLVYAAMERDKSGQRRFALSKLADSAIVLLLNLELTNGIPPEPTTEVEALVLAIKALANGAGRYEGMDLSGFPPANRTRAAELLSHPLLQGNPQAVRMRYALRCLDAPKDFRGQLELIESLRGGGTIFSPQMRLELALLLQQCDRHFEATRMFRDLRQLWREGEHYVEVPDRLRWLLTLDGQSRRQVTAKVMPRGTHRSSAKVRELQETEVLFRPQEFGQQELRPGAVIRGLISFGHNGPFLRPTTAIQN